MSLLSQIKSNWFGSSTALYWNTIEKCMTEPPDKARKKLNIAIEILQVKQTQLLGKLFIEDSWDKAEALGQRSWKYFYFLEDLKIIRDDPRFQGNNFDRLDNSLIYRSTFYR